MPFAHPKWVMDMIMNLVWDLSMPAENRMTAEQHLNVVPPVVRSVAEGIMAYHGQLAQAEAALRTSVNAAPAQNGVDAPSVTFAPPLTPDDASGAASPDPVTQSMPLADSPQASVPANAAGR